MAFDTTETIAAPGLVWPYVDPRVDTGVMQDSKNSEGGFPLFAVPGQPGKVWAKKPASADAVARVVEVTIGGTVAQSDKYSVTIAGTKYEVTAGSGDDASDVATALATAVAADANYGATSSSGKVTITATTAGAAANADQFLVGKESTAGTIAKNEKTAGADAVTGGVFIGIAIRKNTCDSYAAGDVINVLRKGRIWVKALGEALSEQAAYVNDSNFGITATSAGGTAIAGGVFKSNAADGKLVQLEIA